MKIKLVFLLSILSAYSTVIAQESKYTIGIYATPGVANIKSSYTDFNTRFGYSTNIKFEYILSDKFSLKFDLGYERKGAKIKDIRIVQDEYDPENTIISSALINYDYIMFPVYASYKTSGNVKLIVDFGINSGYLASYKQKSNTSIEDFQDNINRAKDLDRIDLGLLIGIGMGIPLSDQLIMNIGIKGSYGIMNIVKDQKEHGTSLRNNTLGLYFGVSYKI